MLELRCTVRNCERPLTLKDSDNERAVLTCAAGHHFDQAKEGYWNLTQPQDKKSRDPGDNRDAVLARHRWLQGGYAKGLVGELRLWTERCGKKPRVLDLGCGDGSFGPWVFPDQPENFGGIDLSRHAIKIAARNWPEATWVLANADRGLPVMDESVDCIMSLFGRRPVAEMKRVLAPPGICVVAVPAEDDLIELREVVQKRGDRRSRVDAIIQEMQLGGFKCIEQKQWRKKVEVGPEEVEDALAMTYRARRWSEKSRIEAIGSTEVTLAADLMLFMRDDAAQ